MMESLYLFFQEMFVLYGILAIGILAKKRRILPTDTDQTLTQIILYLTLPCLILFGLDSPFSFRLLEEMLWLIFCSVYALGSAVLIAYFLAKNSSMAHHRKSVYQSLIIFGNQGFMGYAICYLLLGQQGVLYATMFNIPYLFLIWSYGIYLFTKHNHKIDWKLLFLNPGVIATSIGLMLFLSPFSWPAPLGSMLQQVGTTTIPLSMLLIGSLIGNLNLKQVGGYLQNKYLWLTALVKLLVIPVSLFPLSYLPFSAVLITVAVLITGMPSAPTISLYAQKYGGDVHFASMGVSLSTILSMLSLSILYTILQ